QANPASILAVTAFVSWEAVRRLLHPAPVRASIMVTVALAAAVANGLAAWFLRHPGHDLNMRSALLHMGADALASFGVAAAGAVIAPTGGLYCVGPPVALAGGA